MRFLLTQLKPQVRNLFTADTSSESSSIIEQNKVKYQLISRKASKCPRLNFYMVFGNFRGCKSVGVVNVAENRTKPALLTHNAVMVWLVRMG